MKNFRLIIVSILVATLILSACATKTATPAADMPDEPAADVPDVPDEPEEPAEPVTVSLWAQATVTEAGAPPDDWEAYEIILEDLNIIFEYTIIPPSGDGETKLNAAAAANDLPDIFQITSSSDAMNRDNLMNYYELGLIAPVDDMFDMMPVRTETHYNNQILRDMVTFDDQVYALTEPPIIPMREGFVIRQDWLDALDLEAPTTPEELLEVAIAFTEQDPDGNGQNDTFGMGGFIEGPGLGRRFNYVFGAYGVLDLWNFIDADNFGLNVRDPQYYEAMQMMVQLVDADVIDPDWPTLSKDEFRARWKQGRFGIMWEDFAALTNKSNYEPFDVNFPDGYWTPLPPLTGPEGEAYYGLYEGKFQMFAVSQAAADAGKKEAIARLLEWIATDGYYLLGFGVEGENFNLDADGFITLDGIAAEAAYNAPERQPYTQLRNQLVFYNTLAEISARYPNYTAEASGREMTPIDTYLSFFQAQNWVEGFAKKLIPAADNAADFDRYYSEGLLAFVLGQKELTPETWAAYLAGLDDLGAEAYEALATEILQEAGMLP